MRRTLLTDSPLVMVAPLLLWGAHLLFIYIVLAVGCATRPEAGKVMLYSVWGATVAVVVALLLLGGMQFHRLYAERHQPGAESWEVRNLVLKAGPLITIVSLVAVLWAALPLFFIPPCA